jgi:hypothetical protein
MAGRFFTPMEPAGKEFLERLKSEVLVFDGAMGTMLFEAGLVDGSLPGAVERERRRWSRTSIGPTDRRQRSGETNTFGDAAC